MQDCGTITEWSMDRTSRAEARSRRHAAAEAAGDGGGSPTCVAAPTCRRLPAAILLLHVPGRPAAGVSAAGKGRNSRAERRHSLHGCGGHRRQGVERRAADRDLAVILTLTRQREKAARGSTSRIRAVPARGHRWRPPPPPRTRPNPPKA